MNVGENIGGWGGGQRRRKESGRGRGGELKRGAPRVSGCVQLCECSFTQFKAQSVAAGRECKAKDWTLK